MKAGVLIALAWILLMAPAAGGSDAPGNQNLKVVLHVEAHQTRTCSKNMPSISGRADFNRVWDTYTDVDVFFVIFSYDSLTGVEFGLKWPQDWGSAFTCHCADFAIGSISDPGDGMAMTWQTCRRSDAGPRYWPVAWTWLAPASDGEVEITPHLLKTSDCAFQITEPESIFNAGLNVDPYEGPPGGGVAVQPMTWGGVKAMFQ